MIIAPEIVAENATISKSAGIIYLTPSPICANI